MSLWLLRSHVLLVQQLGLDLLKLRLQGRDQLLEVAFGCVDSLKLRLFLEFHADHGVVGWSAAPLLAHFGFLAEVLDQVL